MNFLHISFDDIAFAKGKVHYLHDKVNINSGAFSIHKSAEINILLPRFVGATSICIEILNGNTGCSFKSKYSAPKFYDHIYDSFTIKIDTSFFGTGIYFFKAIVNTPYGNLYGYQNSEDMVLSDKTDGNFFQFSIVSLNEERLSKYNGGIIYHIFVDRFAKGGKVPRREDAILRSDWENAIPDFPEYPGAFIKNNTFFGGTLWGIIDKLDYIKSLGVSIIYLSPIFEAYSNHKYDTADYFKVDEMFGGEKALKALIKEARKREIFIILDGVFNHTGDDSVYFNRGGRYKSIGAYQSKESPYYEWYDFQNHPDEYTCWWGIEILPRINPDIPSCGDFLAGDGGVIEKYMSLGVAGFRLDVADELSDEFLKKIKSKLCQIDNNAILYGEVWEDASNKIAYGKRKTYYLGEELDGVMNYPLRTGIISYLRDKDINPLKYAISEVMFNAPLSVRNVMMNLLGTHDTERIITALAGECSEGKTNYELSEITLSESERIKGENLVRQAYTIISTLPGIPSIFYGDEVGLEGYSDPFNRRPFPWNSGCKELLAFYKKLGCIRKSEKVLANGDFILNYLDKDLLLFTRSLESEAILTAVNNSDKPIVLKFDSKVLNIFDDLKYYTIVIKPQETLLLKTTTSNSFYKENTGEPI